MMPRRWVVAVVGGALVAIGAAHPHRAAGQVVGGGASAVELSLGKPLMGENYDPLTGGLGVEARLARGLRSGFIFYGVFVRSNAGQAKSAVLGNPTVGMWMRRGGVPLEVEVSLPLMQEWGDDNFATDVARLSDLQYRERYLPGRWALSAAMTPQWVSGDGSSGGIYLGGIAVLPHADYALDVRARYEAWFRLRFPAHVQGGARFAGTVRLSGDGGLDQRTQQSLALFLALPTVRGYPELSFRFPVDIDLQDYVTGVVGVRVRF